MSCQHICPQFFGAGKLLNSLECIIEVFTQNTATIKNLLRPALRDNTAIPIQQGNFSKLISTVQILYRAHIYIIVIFDSLNNP